MQQEPRNTSTTPSWRHVLNSENSRETTNPPKSAQPKPQSEFERGAKRQLPWSRRVGRRGAPGAALRPGLSNPPVGRATPERSLCRADGQGQVGAQLSGQGSAGAIDPTAAELQPRLREAASFQVQLPVGVARGGATLNSERSLSGKDCLRRWTR